MSTGDNEETNNISRSYQTNIKLFKDNAPLQDELYRSCLEEGSCNPLTLILAKYGFYDEYNNRHWFISFGSESWKSCYDTFPRLKGFKVVAILTEGQKHLFNFEQAYALKQRVSSDKQIHLLIVMPRENRRDSDHFEALQWAVNLANPDVIITYWHHANQELESVIKKGVEQGIQFITYYTIDRIPDVSPHKIAYLSWDQNIGGQKLGQYISENLREGGDVLILRGRKDSTMDLQRVMGLKNGLETNPRIRILEEVPATDFNIDPAKQLARMYLINNPQIRAIIGTSSGAGIGAGKAVKEMISQGKCDQDIRIFSLDGIRSEIKAISDQLIHSTLFIPSVGELCGQYVIALKNARPIPHEQILDTSIKTREDTKYLRF